MKDLVFQRVIFGTDASNSLPYYWIFILLCHSPESFHNLHFWNYYLWAHTHSLPINSIPIPFTDHICAFGLDHSISYMLFVFIKIYVYPHLVNQDAIVCFVRDNLFWFGWMNCWEGLQGLCSKFLRRIWGLAWITYYTFIYKSNMPQSNLRIRCWSFVMRVRW